jgi:hypothetical protein
MAQITMSLPEYQELTTQRDEARQHLADLKAKVANEQLSDPEGIIESLVSALHASLPIVKFAAGNLDPRTVRGWPYDALEHYAQVLDELPGADTVLRETALEFRNFIFEGRTVESERYSSDAARFDGNATLTMVFRTEKERDAFLVANGKMLPPKNDARRRFYVCTFESMHLNLGTAKKADEQ